MSKLPEKMKAVVCYAPGDYRVEEVDRPKAEEEEVILKVKGCGICASDVKAYHGADRYWAGEDSFLKAPVIPGHEFFGEVVELGSGAGEKFDVEIGDMITSDPLVPCGKCEYCEVGNYWMCEVHNIYGFKKGVVEGAMAEYVRLKPNSNLHKVPDKLTDEEACFIEPAANGLHAVDNAEIQFDDVVVLAGAGSIGLAMLQLASLKTPKKLIVLDIDDRRLELAKKFGADLCINPGKEDAVKIVKDLTDGYGCDVYIESTGSTAGVKQGLEMLRKLGRFVEFSVFGEETSVDWSVISVGKELTLKGAHLAPYTYPIIIDFLERDLLSAEGVVTHAYDLENFDEAMKMAETKDSIKVILKP